MASKTVRITVTLLPEQVRWLNEQSQGIGRSALVRQAIEHYRRFLTLGEDVERMLVQRLWEELDGD
jgi:hypothetical protein